MPPVDQAETERPLTPGEVARIFGVSVTTVGMWADRGRLPHFRTPGGQRRFRRDDVDALLSTDSSVGTSAPEGN